MAELIFFADRLVIARRIMPPRGPRRVLWVVVVTTWACGNGIGMHAARHQAGEMRHVHHQDGADLVGDLAEALEVPDARNRRCRRR